MVQTYRDYKEVLDILPGKYACCINHWIDCVWNVSGWHVQCTFGISNADGSLRMRGIGGLAGWQWLFIVSDLNLVKITRVRM